MKSRTRVCLVGGAHPTNATNASYHFLRVTLASMVSTTWPERSLATKVQVKLSLSLNRSIVSVVTPSFSLPARSPRPSTLQTVRAAGGVGLHRWTSQQRHPHAGAQRSISPFCELSFGGRSSVSSPRDSAASCNGTPPPGLRRSASRLASAAVSVRPAAVSTDASLM